MSESSGSFETLVVDLGAPDAFDRIRAFLPRDANSDDEIRDAIAERRELKTVTVTRWFTLPRSAFRHRQAHIVDPSDAPSVGQLMEDLNTALGNRPLGAEPVTPRSVWERLLQQVRDRA